MWQPECRDFDDAMSAVFRKTNELYGGLSNMAGGFPLCVNGVPILTSEALYQACRFPQRADIQRLILDQRSPMAAKMVGKPYRTETRPDWEEVRVEVMRWCLRVKLAQNWDRFGELLLSTAALSIVEESRRDDFWGAKRVDARRLRGCNVLGSLLMELREQLEGPDCEALRMVEPPAIPEFKLLGSPIRVVRAE